MTRARTEAEIEREDRNAAGAAVLIVVALLAAFVLSPGMMIVSFCLRPFVELDRGQMWVFSIAACLATAVGLRIAFDTWERASRIYAGACVVAVGAFTLAKFGLHSDWPDLMWDEFAKAGGR